VTEYGVLALQGDWAAHGTILRKLGAHTCPVRTAAELDRVDALVIPGGESSAMLRLMEPENLSRRIRDRIVAGMAVLATCAGVILLAENIQPTQQGIAVLDVDVVRNAYGRQLHSTVAEVFIRAPRIVRVSSNVIVLGRWRDDPVLIRQGQILGATFHPELSTDRRIHEMFMKTGEAGHG